MTTLGRQAFDKKSREISQTLVRTGSSSRVLPPALAMFACVSASGLVQKKHEHMTHLIRNYNIGGYRVARLSYPFETQRSRKGDSSQPLMAYGLEPISNERRPQPISDKSKLGPNPRPQIRNVSFL